MKLSKLMEHLREFLLNKGDVEVDIITETEAMQTEQPLGGVAYSPHEQRVKLVPEGF